MNKTCRTYSRAGRTQETSVVQASKLCRLCMSRNDNDTAAVNIFDVKDEPLTSTMINFCTGLECSETDGLPDKLCSKCYVYILDFYAFKKMCLASFDKLNKNIEISKELSKSRFDGELRDPLASPSPKKEEEDPLIDLDTKVDESDNVIVLGMRNVHPDAPDEVMIKIGKSAENLCDSLLISDEDETAPGDKRLECCGVSFVDLDTLSNHHREFHKIIRFYCHVCYKGFKSKSAVVRHLPVHTGYRPFKCGICAKGFSQKESLSRHMPIHTDRRFECEQCGKVLLSLDGLKCHVKTAHTPRTPEDFSKYKCKWCHKVFMHASGLSRHSALHNGVRYFCDECQRIFNDSSQLRRHVAKAHPPTSPTIVIG